jgi:S-adenosylmethionine hydrolase
MTTVTLLTDFGSRSPYPAQVKGVLRGLCRATLVDVTHDIPPHDIAQGAFVLASVAPVFPAGAVHLAVVDPGVGTARRPLAVTSGGQFLVGPDNGLLTAAARTLGEPRSFVIDAARIGRHPIAPTFHGRDLFAPAAAALAGGLPIETLGIPAGAMVNLPGTPPQRSAGRLLGHVMYKDPFGNLITDIPGAWLGDLPAQPLLQHPRGRLPIRRARTYGDVSGAEVLVLVGSAATLEIAINAGSAAEALGLEPGDQVQLSS